jgi:hypothetical protein
MPARPSLAAVGCAVALAVTAPPADAVGALQLGTIRSDTAGPGSPQRPTTARPVTLARRTDVPTAVRKSVPAIP